MCKNSDFCERMLNICKYLQTKIQNITEGYAILMKAQLTQLCSLMTIWGGGRETSVFLCFHQLSAPCWSSVCQRDAQEGQQVGHGTAQHSTAWWVVRHCGYMAHTSGPYPRGITRQETKEEK